MIRFNDREKKDKKTIRQCIAYGFICMISIIVFIVCMKKLGINLNVYSIDDVIIFVKINLWMSVLAIISFMVLVITGFNFAITMAVEDEKRTRQTIEKRK